MSGEEDTPPQLPTATRNTHVEETGTSKATPRLPMWHFRAFAHLHQSRLMEEIQTSNPSMHLY